MAECCPDCQERMFQDRPLWGYQLTRELEICEGCGEWKRVVVGDYGWAWLCRRAHQYLFVILVMCLFFFLRWLLLLPFRCYKWHKAKRHPHGEGKEGSPLG